MNTTITLAASTDLVGSYHAMFDGILNSTAGQVITKLAAAGAVLIALGIIFGAIFKLIGRPNKLSQMFCPSLGRIIILLLIIFVLAGPLFTIPGLLKIIDWFVNAGGQQTSDYLGV